LVLIESVVSNTAMFRYFGLDSRSLDNGNDNAKRRLISLVWAKYLGIIEI
jgi:hypothetical protein